MGNRELQLGFVQNQALTSPYTGSPHLLYLYFLASSFPARNRFGYLLTFAFHVAQTMLLQKWLSQGNLPTYLLAYLLVGAVGGARLLGYSLAVFEAGIRVRTCTPNW